MKAKLLKKLRKQYEIQSRNGKYRVFDNVICIGDIYNKSEWTTIDKAREIRREWILKKALGNGREPKRFNLS